MSVEARRSEFLDRLYAAAVGADGWKDVLESYTQLVGGHASLLSLYDLPAGKTRTIEWHNFSEGYISASNAQWKAVNPWSVAGQQLFRDPQALKATGFVSAGSALVSQRDLFATEWYNEFAADSLVQDCLSTIGLTSAGIGMALIANTGGRPPAAYTPDQVAQARLVQPDVQRAINLHIRSGGHVATAPAELRLKVPVLVIKDRRILSSNPEAGHELELGRLVRTHRATLFGSQDQKLDRMVATMCRPDGAQQMSCLATALDGSRFLAQAIRFNRLRGTLMEAAGMDDPAVILILTPIGDRVAGREAALRAFSSFTPMEGAISMALVNGQSITEIARERRVSVPTIRWHIRNMIDKTGENGVRGLTRILTLLLPY